MEAKKKICVGCGTEQYIWARKMCKACASKNPKKKSGLKPPVEKKPFKVSGELALFQSIWQTRPHICAVTGEKLGEFNPWFFSHILPKGMYPKFRLYEKNIVLKSAEMHHKWETSAHSDLEKDPRWIPILKLREELLEEYRAIEKQ